MDIALLVATLLCGMVFGFVVVDTIQRNRRARLISKQQQLDELYLHAVERAEKRHLATMLGPARHGIQKGAIHASH